MCPMPSSVVGELKEQQTDDHEHYSVAAVDRLAALNKQYSQSSPQSEDELDTPAALELANAGSATSYLDDQVSQQQEPACTGPVSPSSSTDSIWASAEPLLKTLAPAVLLLVAFKWVFSKLRKRRQQKHSGDQQAEQQLVGPESSLAVYASDFTLEPRVASPGAAQLTGVRCVVAEHVAVQGAVVGCGVPEVWHQCPVSSESALIVKKLLNLGISITGQGSIQPCNYPTIGDNIRNPVGRFRVTGGGASGAAVAVALGDADIAVASDFLGSQRMPAACMGLYGFTASAGEPSSSTRSNSAPNSSRSSTTDADHTSNGGAADAESRRSSNAGSSGSSSSLEHLGLISSDLGLICRVGSLLGLPSPCNLRHELTQVVVAEDLFQLCEDDMAPGILAVKRAVLAWAGNEQAGSVQLLQFLEANTNAWRKLTPPSGAPQAPSADEEEESNKPNSPELPQILTALTYAAELLYHHDLSEHYQDLLQGCSEAELGPQVAHALASGASVCQQQLELARRVQKEVQDVMKAAVKKDVVVVVPCIPAAPPRLDAPQETQHSWLRRCHAFSALTALAGCPSVVLPTGALADGGPLGLALFSQSRSDQRLLAVAHRLVPHIQSELVKLRQQAEAEKEAAAQAAAGNANNTQAPQTPQVDPKRAARGEKAKARGNDAYKAGRYTDAIKAYSEAIKQNPSHPVYFNNRAMAYLKVFSFEAAESDCNRALAFKNLQPADRVKALLRRGTARMHKGDLRGARSDFREVLTAEPNNRQAQEELKALRQQERDMEDTRRQHAVAAAAAVSASNGRPGLPPGMDAWDPAAAQLFASGQGPEPLMLQQSPGSIGGLPGLGPGGEQYLAGLEGLNPGVDAGQFEAMLRTGGMSVVLGENGEAVCGPGGEPVIVGPDGQELAIEPSGKIRPYTPRSAVA